MLIFVLTCSSSLKLGPDGLTTQYLDQYALIVLLGMVACVWVHTRHSSLTQYTGCTEI